MSVCDLLFPRITAAISMPKLIALFILTLAAARFAGAQLTISTFAGNGTPAYAGDAGPASAAELFYPIDVSSDGGGNLYIADQDNNRIRMVNSNGVISTLAGTGNPGFSGDGGQATQAMLNSPICVFSDPFGRGVYISDVGNQVIRLISPSGTITTIAGIAGLEGYSGDGGPATSATFYNPVRVTVDPSADIIIADQSNHVIRKINHVTGIITTIAGTTQGFSGDGGPATAAQLNNPTSVVSDLQGNLYICDQFNFRIRKVDTSGTITTIAGTGTAGYSGDGGPATMAELNYPGGMTIDTSGNLFFSDDTNNVVREISGSTAVITTVAGNGTAGYSGDGGPATSAELNGNFGVTLDSLGNLYIADAKNNVVRLIGQASPIIPTFTANALTNAASFASGGSAGALATLFGTHLSVNLNGVVGATQSPLPDTLNGTTVTVDGVAAPILAVSNTQLGGQINFQIPWEVAGQQTIAIVVNNGMGTSASVSMPIAITAAQPGVFQIYDSNLAQQVGAVEHVDGSVVSSLSPAAPGETVVVYCTGLGPVSPALVTGLPAPGSPLSYTTYMPTVTIGAIGATVDFSGAAPYFSGLNQMNVTVPANAPSGLQPMVVSVNGVSATPVNLSIQ
jgi:uncharacterized protein (TIGR03437 family)